MTRKPLPKAITRSVASLREIAADFVSDEQGRVPRVAPTFDAVEPEPTPAEFMPPNTAISPQVSAMQSPQPDKTDPSSSAAETTTARTDPLAVKRRALAKKIVDRHRLYATGGGLIPLPVVNIAGVTAVILRMVKQLSDLYEIPFERDRTRALIVSIIGGAVPTGLGAATTSALAWIIPGGLLYGLAVSAATAGALTRGIGQVFVESFESRATAPEITEAKPA
jgi:uncharacterized protein (DUF697 family)